jgi:hypothetical protein
MLRNYTVNTTPNAYKVSSSFLVGRTALKVKRSGKCYDIIPYDPFAVSLPTIGNRQVGHDAANGLLIFDTPFNTSEKVYFLIK